MTLRCWTITLQRKIAFRFWVWPFAMIKRPKAISDDTLSMNDRFGEAALQRLMVRLRSALGRSRLVD